MKQLTSICAALICLVISTLNAAAQAPEDYPEPESNKMFVVVAVVGVIFVGISLFLLVLDRRISKLERQFEEKQQINQ